MTKTLIAALALTTASMAAFAESPAASGPLNQRVTAPTMSRAAVVQELMAARAAGTLMRAGELGQVPTAFVPEESRAEVRNEVLTARAAGTLMRAGELGQVPPAFVSGKSRAEVRAEVLGRRGPHALGFQPA